MIRSFASAAALSLGAAVIPVPAFAQNAAQNGVLVIYGNDKCPTNKNGDEIVVCQRMDEAERFRIPKQLRNFQVTPQNEAWAARLTPSMEAGDTGIGSCTNVGAGGGTGCFVNRAGTWRREEQARKKAETEIPLP